MNQFKLRIVQVDMYGYTGRDYHPEATDVGLVVTPIQMSVFHFDLDPEDGSMIELFEDGVIAPLSRVTDEENHVAIWTAVTSDGRTLELIDTEVELVSLQEA